MTTASEMYDMYQEHVELTNARNYNSMKTKISGETYLSRIGETNFIHISNDSKEMYDYLYSEEGTDLFNSIPESPDPSDIRNLQFEPTGNFSQVEILKNASVIDIYKHLPNTVIVAIHPYLKKGEHNIAIAVDIDSPKQYLITRNNLANHFAQPTVDKIIKYIDYRKHLDVVKNILLIRSKNILNLLNSIAADKTDTQTVENISVPSIYYENFNTTENTGDIVLRIDNHNIDNFSEYFTVENDNYKDYVCKNIIKIIRKLNSVSISEWGNEINKRQEITHNLKYQIINHTIENNNGVNIVNLNIEFSQCIGNTGTYENVRPEDIHYVYRNDDKFLTMALKDNSASSLNYAVEPATVVGCRLIYYNENAEATPEDKYRDTNNRAEIVINQLYPCKRYINNELNNLTTESVPNIPNIHYFLSKIHLGKFNSIWNKSGEEIKQIWGDILSTVMAQEYTEHQYNISGSSEYSNVENVVVSVPV